MSPISITPITTLNLQAKYGTFSNYAQRIMKSQIRNVYYAMERFFNGFDSELISQHEQRLKEIGIKQIGKDIHEGVIVSDKKYDYHVFLSNRGNLRFNIFEPECNQVCRYISLNDKDDKFIHAGYTAGANPEDEINKILDFIDRCLFKAKREITLTKIPRPFIPQQTTPEAMAKISSTIQSIQKNTDIKNAGFLSPKEGELIESINEKYRFLRELYMKILDGRTKYKVRLAYKNYMPQPVANKLGFKNIGPNGESIILFNTSHKNNPHSAIIVTDANGKELNFVISLEKKSVQKNFTNKSVNSGFSEYRIHQTPDFYTQKEIDESNLHSYLSCLNEEMEQFIEYTQGWFKQKEELRLIRANYNSATLEQYQDILDDIRLNFKKYKTKMRKYLTKYPKSRMEFKTKNNISTKPASTAVKFDKITPDGYDLRLSYPKVRNKTATQLLVMRGDKIENSFYIINNKLLRFNIKDIKDKIIHYGQKMYYYDEKYLQDSNLPDYLLLLQNKLHELNTKLDILREEQIKNRKRKFRSKISKAE